MTDPRRPTAAEPAYAGQRLGLPEAGPRSVAGWPMRILALFLDWMASQLVVAAFIGAEVWTGRGLELWGPMAMFLLEASLLTALVGGSFGQLVCRLTVVRLCSSPSARPAPVNLLQALLRTFLICLVIPPLVFNRDGRGLHDMAVGTVTLRR